MILTLLPNRWQTFLSAMLSISTVFWMLSLLLAINISPSIAFTAIIPHQQIPALSRRARFTNNVGTSAPATKTRLDGNSDEKEFFQFLEKMVDKGMAQVVMDGQVVGEGPSEMGGGGDGDGTDETSSSSSTEENDAILDSLVSFDLKPKEVAQYLDRFVIQQNDAKQVLSVAICDHYNHCRRCLQEEEKKLKQNDNNSKVDSLDDYEINQLLEALPDNNDKSNDSPSIEQQDNYAKPNVLLAGPTGVGKTYLLKCLARMIGVPFVKADATKFSETGIVGRDAEDLVRDLVDRANGNTTLASMGIIYVDEIDKIASGSGDERTTKGSFNTRGVQNNFLKLLEDTEVSLERQTDMVIGNLPSFMGGGDRKGPRTISTRNILFIFSGAFTNLDADLRSKKEKKAFGLDITQTGSSQARQTRREENINSDKPRSYLRFAETEDFVRAGLEPEFVGRVPVRVALDALDASDLKQILVGAEGSVWKQFERDMKGYGIQMTATDDGLDEIAKLAEKEKTGARGLVTVLERTLRRHKYELPSTSVDEFVLDRATVLNPELELMRLLDSQTADDDMAVIMRDLTRWEAKLNQQLPWPAKARLTDDAISYIVLESLERSESAYSFATRHFGNALAAVIRKVNAETSQTTFYINIDVAKNPKKELRKWLDLVTGQTAQDDSDVVDAEIVDGENAKKKQE